MDQGLAILRHALRMIFHDLGATLRITVMPMLIGVGLVVLVFVVLGAEPPEAPPMPAPPGLTAPDPRLVLALLLVLPVMLVCLSWLAVAWHRYALADEPPGALLPRFPGGQIGPYILGGVKLFLAAIAVSVPALLVLGLLLAPLGTEGALPGLVGAAVQIAISVVILRLSLILPAAALGRPLTLAASWQATRGAMAPLVTVAAALLLVQTAARLLPVYGTPASLAGLVLSWFSVTLGISVLTTLYGTRIEGRSLRNGA